MFKLEFETSGAAFDDLAGYEISRILREIADIIEDTHGNWTHTITDCNGNSVGKLVMTGD